MSETAPRAKLPLWRTVRESYAWGLGHLGTVVNKAWLVLLVLAAVSFVLHWLAHPFVASSGSVSGNLFSLILIPAAIIVFGAMVAVPWHRFVLDGEPLPAVPLAWPPRVLSYVSWGIAMSAPLYLGLLVMASAPESTETEAGADMAASVILAGAVVGLTAIFVLVRLGIKLPAVALGHETVTIREVWRVTSWNFWRLFLGSIVTFLPPLVVGIAVIYFVPDQESPRWLYAIGNMLYSIVEVLLGLSSLTFLSLAYRHFFPKA